MDEHIERHDEPTHTLPPLTELPQTNEPARIPKRLHRSHENKLFLGICGGLAEYFDFDATLMRLMFVAGSLLGGATVFVYLVLMLIMPAEDQLDTDPRAAAQSTLDEAGAEIQRGMDYVVDKARSLTGRKSPPAGP